jgi:hypothetical protein
MTSLIDGKIMLPASLSINSISGAAIAGSGSRAARPT